MDRRYKPLTAHEQLQLRQALSDAIGAQSDMALAQVVRTIRKTLRLTINDMAKVCGVSAQTLKNVEAARNSPTLETAERLLRPFGLRMVVAPDA